MSYAGQHPAGDPDSDIGMREVDLSFDKQVNEAVESVSMWNDDGHIAVNLRLKQPVKVVARVRGVPAGTFFLDAGDSMIYL